jgi:hypothetical protein
MQTSSRKTFIKNKPKHSSLKKAMIQSESKDILREIKKELNGAKDSIRYKINS